MSQVDLLYSEVLNSLPFLVMRMSKKLICNGSCAIVNVKCLFSVLMKVRKALISSLLEVHMKKTSSIYLLYVEMCCRKGFLDGFSTTSSSNRQCIERKSWGTFLDPIFTPDICRKKSLSNIKQFVVNTISSNLRMQSVLGVVLSALHKKKSTALSPP